MTELEYDLTQLCKRNRDGSRATQVARLKILRLTARQLHQLGFRHMRLNSLGTRHIWQVTSLWKQGHYQLGYRPVATGTLKNRLSHLRWWAEKINKQNVVPRCNQELGIGKRAYKTNQSKATQLHASSLQKITDPHIRASLLLQAMFGLRREEAMKIQPRLADKGESLALKGSWCKGGRERAIPIRTHQQRQILNQAKLIAGNGSLIPSDKTYRQHKDTWEYQTQRAGISRTHGMRHRYAQQRYLEITGWKAPADGGPIRGQLTVEQRVIDTNARQSIAEELGHGRSEISNVYLGR